MVEGARLESVYTRKGIKGSNPLVSADHLLFRITLVNNACKLIDLQALLIFSILKVKCQLNNIKVQTATPLLSRAIRFSSMR